MTGVHIRVLKVAYLALLVTVPTTLFLACGGGEKAPTEPEVPGEAASIDVVSGNSQSDTVAQTLPDSLVVRVSDDSGEPVSGASVSWDVVEGGGDLSSGTTTSDSQGRAETRWTLGKSSGEQAVQASVSGAGEVRFTATALPGPPDTIHVTPARDTFRVNATRILQASVADEYGNPIDRADVTLTWSAEDESVATVNDRAVVQGTGKGITRIEAAAGDAVGVSRMTVVAPNPKSGTRTVSGTAEVPAGLDSSAAYVSTLLGGAERVEDGGFQAEVSEDAATAVSLNHGTTPVGLAVVPAGGSSSGALGPGVTGLSAESGVRIDAASTAASLLYLTPPFGRAPPEVDGELLALIASQPETGGLADVISSRRAEDGSLPGAADRRYREALVDAYRAVVESVQEEASQQTRQWLAAQDPWRLKSGLELSVPSFDAEQATAKTQIRNHYVRWVTLYRHDATVEGEPKGDFNFHPWLVVRPADPCTGDRTTAKSWADDCLIPIAKGETFPSGPLALNLTFQQDRPRKLVLAYGPGNSLRDPLEPAKADRYLMPTVWTVAELWVLPVASPLAGGAVGRMGEAATTETVDRAIGFVEARLDALRDLIDCLKEDGRISATSCVAKKLFLAGGEELRELLIQVVEELDPGLTEQFTNEELEGATWVDRLNYWIQRSVGALEVGVTGGVVSFGQAFKSEPRVDFDFGYNLLLGADDISIVEPGLRDGQTGVPGEPLPRELAVRVTRSEGEPLAKAWVQWELQEGNGQVAGEDTAVTETDAEGQSSVQWTLGPDTGSYSLTARLAGSTTKVKFTATAEPKSNSTGDLEVSASTSGEDQDSDGYTVTVDGSQEQSVDPNGSVTFTDLSAGDHEVELSGIASNCSVDGQNPRTVTVEAGSTATTSFSINCSSQTIRITDEEADQRRPAISGDRVVWTDRRHGNWDVFLYDLSEGVETQITDEDADQTEVAIFGDRIVWEDQRSGNGDLFLYDISTNTETQITDDDAHMADPSIYGDRIVWADTRNGNWDIFLYDLSTGNEIQITDADSLQTEPDIYGDRIVWMDRRDGTWDVYLYDLSTETETKIAGDPVQEGKPAIFGDRIVWERWRSGNQNPDIYMYDISAKSETRITDEEASQRHPEISSDRIVWWDTRFDGHADIFLYDLSTQSETRITTNDDSQWFPDISEDRIVWEDDRSGNDDIFLFEIP